MITIGIIYGILAVLYLVVALINVRNNAILIDKTPVGAWLALVLMAAIWPIALILDTVTWCYIHK